MALLDREPQTFSKGAAQWASRLALEHTLTLAGTQLARAALAGLPTPGAQAGVDRLGSSTWASALDCAESTTCVGVWMRRRAIGYKQQPAILLNGVTAATCRRRRASCDGGVWHPVLS